VENGEDDEAVFAQGVEEGVREARNESLADVREDEGAATRVILHPLERLLDGREEPRAEAGALPLVAEESAPELGSRQPVIRVF
jgi:hypothetical protein